MSQTSKNIANAGLAGAITGVTIGAAAVLLSDKKRRNTLLSKANTIKDTVLNAAEKYNAEEKKILTKAGGKTETKVSKEKEELKKSLI